TYFHQTIVDIATGESLIRNTQKNETSFENFVPLTPGLFLVSRSDKKLAETTTLSLFNYVSGREIKSIPFTARPRREHPVWNGIRLSTDWGMFVSEDRKIVTCAFDNIAMCRRTQDLDTLWTAETDPEMIVMRGAMSPEGNIQALN